MMKVARGVPRVGIKLPLWFTLFTVWSMQAVARKEGRDGGKEGGGVFWVTTVILHYSILIL